VSRWAGIVIATVACSACVFAQGNTKANRINAGPIIPLACNPLTGDVFYLTVAPLGVYFCSTANVWTRLAPSTIGGGGALPPFTAGVSGSTSIGYTAGQHSQGTNAIASCFDASGNGVGCSWSRNGSGDISLTFNPAFNGTVQITGYSTVYTTSVVSQTSVSILNGTHAQGSLAEAFCFDVTTNLSVACAWTRNAFGDLSFTFNPAWSGTIQVIGTNTSPYTTPVTNQTHVVVASASHGKGMDPELACFDTGGVSVACGWSRDNSGNVTANFSPAFSGLLEIVGAGSGSVGGDTGGVQLTPTSTAVCDVAHEGAIYYTPGTPGSFQACLHLTNGSYGLRTVDFTVPP
jgi:hypothetical protein